MLLRGNRGIRYPAVAGMFYESDPDALREQIEWCFKHPVGPGRLPEAPADLVEGFAGYIAPHAGYIYSGPVAAHTYLRLASRGRPETVIIAGPNHTGLGTMVSVMAEGVWATPLGHVEVDSELAEAIVRHSKYADIDERAHIHEHSVEVQLPFLQYLYGDSIRIVPIVMYAQMMQTAADLASAVAHALKETRRRVVFIASSDFSHYVSYEDAYRRDRHALKAIEALDAEKLFRVIEEHDISMCGPGPVATMLILAKTHGATRTEILKYATSGDTSGDKGMVVGYAAAEAIPGA